MNQSTKLRAKHKPEKPYPDFPLFPHATGRWAKKIRGKMQYFGPWRDPDGALQLYLDQRDDLHAGRTPRAGREGATVRGIVNRFLTTKQRLLESGEIIDRTFRDYYSTCERIIEAFGKARYVDDLVAEDFEVLRLSLASTRGPVSLGNEIQRVRMVFKYAYDQGLIDKPIRYGQSFTKPSQKTLRKTRAANGKRMFEAEQIRSLIEAAKQPLRAMILLGVNCGFGQTDISSLPQSAVDLNASWVDFPRPKTGIDRRCPLWPETVAAMGEAIAMRPAAKTEVDADLTFITKYGQRWVKTHKPKPREGAENEQVERGRTPADAIGQQFGKLLTSIGMKRRGLSFYALRHTFETIAGESRDQVAVNYIMGHAAASNDMSAVYRERISDERLVAVTDYVREWLFGYAHILGYTDAAVTLAKQISEQAVQNGLDEEKWRSRKNPLWDALIGENHLKESSGRDALNLAGDGDEAAMAWIRVRDWGESRNSPGTDLTQSLSLK